MGISPRIAMNVPAVEYLSLAGGNVTSVRTGHLEMARDGSLGGQSHP